MPTSSSKRETHRRKIALACEPCRERKSRCDGGKPICASCRRRSFTLEQCIYKADNARTESNDSCAIPCCSCRCCVLTLRHSYIRALHQRIRELEQALTARSAEPAGQEAPLPSEPAPSPRARPDQAVGSGRESNGQLAYLASHSGHVSADPGHQVESPYRFAECRHTCASRNPLEFDTTSESQVSAMGALASADEDLETQKTDEFFGRSSAASFMQQAYSDRSNVPPPHSCRNDPSAAGPTALNWTPSSPYRLYDFVLPPRAMADHLMERFWDRVYCLYPFLHRQTFERQYERLWTPAGALPTDTLPSASVGLGGSPESPANLMVFHCALNAIFALGCHFSDLAPLERDRVARSFFLRAKSLIGLDLLEVNSIAVVQALLFLALCLQSMQYPSRVWNAVGIACRVAQGLGLHTDVGDDRRSALTVDVRRRTWHGCVHMDT